jgi:arylsulfatase A-like enzyme
MAFAQSRPNIIFFLADDLGYGDVGCFWQDQRTATKKFDTPALDLMAAEGAKMTHHYVAASVCAPSRASLLQGRHQGHSDVRNSQFDKSLPDTHNIASLLKSAGYRTIHIGKNGLAGAEGSASFPAHPLNRGFDRFFGYLFHADGHEHYPRNGTTNKTAYIYDDFQKITNASVDLYTTDAWTAAAKKEIIDEATDNDNQPFFLYLAYDAPHFNMQRPAVAYPALDHDGNPLTGGIQWTTATDGAGNIRYASTANGTGTVDGFTHPAIPSGWTNAEKQHVGMIRRIDESVADIMKTLVDLGIDQNTICVFTTDNGPHNEGNDPRTFESFANMEGIKRDMWEAGIRAPTIVRWPGQILGATGNPNNIREISYPSGQWDWMPTFCQLAGVPAPAWADGVSLVPTLTGSGAQRDKGYLYFEFQNNGTTPNWTAFPNHGGDTQGEMQAIRIGNHMGVRTGITTGSEPFKIYDVTTDPAQANDLAPSLPAVQSRMQGLALTARRPGAGIARPYDHLPLPAAAPAATSLGVRWQSFSDPTATWQWVPEFRDMTSTADGTTAAPTLSVRPGDEHFGLLFSGFIQIPTAGSYTFYLDSDTGSDFFLHEGHLIANDRNHSPSVTSAAVNLAAGLHPFRLYYRHSTGSRNLNLEWSGPGIGRQTIPAAAFRFEIPPPPGPPVSNDDTATTAYQSPVLIDVLGNDSDDGTPGPLAIQSVAAPDFGTATIEGGQIRYTPPAGFSGTAVFEYIATDGAEIDTATVTVTVSFPQPSLLWTTSFSGLDGSNRILTNQNGAPAFTDGMLADDANLSFQDGSFNGSPFMQNGAMAGGGYYSPNTNVDNPAASAPQNGGWWQAEFRYSGGSQRISLANIALEVVWSNSNGAIQSSDPGTPPRDITLSLEYTLNGGVDWQALAPAQTYGLTEAPGEDQKQTRVFTPGVPLAIDHGTQDFWIRVKAENSGATAGAYVNLESIAFNGFVTPLPFPLWTTTFSGADGNSRQLTNTRMAAGFTDTLAADDHGLTFQDSSFTGSVFMHSGAMASGNYYSPRTNVDSPAVASPQNGGWWQAEFRYAGGVQTVDLSDIVLEVLWSNSSGAILGAGNNYGSVIRDVTLGLEYSLDGGGTWTPVAASQTYDLTEPEAADQTQFRIFTPASALRIDHSTQDLWLRVRAENAHGTAGGYVNLKSISFAGLVVPAEPDDYETWALDYPEADLSNPAADFDNDGQTNDEERLWGLDPTDASDRNPVSILLDPTTRSFRYSRRNPSLTGAVFSYEYSLDLGAWLSFTPASLVSSGGMPVEMVTVEVPGDIMGVRMFVRVIANDG